MTQRDAVDVAAEPAAWVDFAANGNVRFWTADQYRAQRETEAGRAMQPLYTVDALRSASNSGAEALAETDALIANYIDHADVPDEEEEAYCRAVDRHYARTDGKPLPAPGAPASPWLGNEEEDTIRVPVYDDGGGGPEDGEEIARSRAPVGEDERIRALLGDPRDSVSVGPEGPVYHHHEAPTPPAKDTGETRAPNYADMTSPQLLAEISDLERRIAKAIDELHGVEAGDSSVYEVIDILDPKATLNREEDERIADLEARLAEAIRERDEARSSLETAERRIGEARDAVKKAAAHAAEGSFVEAHLDHAIGILCAALTPDAGTARSEDEEGE